MTKTLESVQVLLAGNTYMYKMFQTIFGEEPTAAQLDILTNDTTKEALDLFRIINNTSFTKGLEFLEELERQFKRNKDGVLDQLTSEYTRLLIGPGKLPAPPWESVYRSKEALLFQDSTLEVRRCYMRFGFIPVEYPHVADDHLSLELDFMGNLGIMAEKAYVEADFNQLAVILESQKDFLTNHLLVWVPEFAKRMQKSSTALFYPEMANLLAGFLGIQTEVIGEITDTI